MHGVQLDTCIYPVSKMYLNKKTMFVLIILVTITITEVFGDKRKKVIYVNVDDYHTCFPLVARPRHTTRANQTIQLFGETLEATRHHVIPYSTLATFFSLVIREDRVISELGVYLARRIRDIWDFFSENDGAGAIPPNDEPRTPCDSTITFEGSSATFDVDYRMLAAFTWIPGNMFYGPPSRKFANYTKETFKKDAIRIVGSQAFAVLKRIYVNMNKYINYLSERTTRNFDKILNDLSDVAEINTPYKFNAADWEETSGNNTGNKLFALKKPKEITKEVTDVYNYKTWAIGLRGMCDDYMKAADRVCEVYTSHLQPKLNTNFTHVDITSDTLPLFAYTINDKHFVYGQNENTKAWFIRTVEPNGTVGAVLDQGFWSNYYAIQFPFEINGKHYFYGHNLKSNYWFIQELNANGTIGRETDQAYFGESYTTLFHIHNNGQHYIYGRRNADYKKIFFQILNADGTMGRADLSHVDGTLLDHIQFPLNVGDTQYIAVRNTNSSLYCISDIDVIRFPRVNKPNICTTLDISYSVLFPISLRGKTFIFGHNPDSNIWIVRQVFGDGIELGSINYEFTNAQPFNINGVQYFYARHKGDSYWSLHKFGLKYLETDNP